MGNFSYWIEKLQDHYQRKTGMRFYPGTLNVRLEEPYSLPERVIRLEASEYGGTVSVSMVPCRMRGQRVLLLRTDANEEGRGHHPKTIVEIACDMRLRDLLFELQDGDAVEIEVER
jgi:riboflavin kinase